MKKMIVECRTCNYKVYLIGDNPMLSFNYLTNGNKVCKKCNNKFKIGFEKKFEGKKK